MLMGIHGVVIAAPLLLEELGVDGNDTDGCKNDIAHVETVSVTNGSRAEAQ
jgi:hypothetical protein